jgi:hypothetical protein
MSANITYSGGWTSSPNQFSSQEFDQTSQYVAPYYASRTR